MFRARGRRGRREVFRRKSRPATVAASAPKPSTWYLLLAVTAVATVVGLVMVLSSSSVQSVQHSQSIWTYVVKQAIWACLGVAALIATARFDYHRWRRLTPMLLAGSTFLLCLVLVPGLGVEINGARSWLAAGPIRLQPAEPAKLALLLFAADLLARRSARIEDSRMTMRPVLVVTGVMVGLMMLQPAMGSTLVMGAIVFGVLFIAGVPGRQLGSVAGLAVVGTGLLAFAAPYRRSRMLVFLHPSSDPMNTGYQLNQSLIGIASGRLFGLGLGESRAKWGFLPNANTDFIFAIIAEELGLFGAVMVIGLFVVYGVAGTRAAIRAPDRFGTYLACGITTWILTQAIINMGSTVGVLPLAGLTLPFISYGGTSLVITLAATGILLNIAASGTQPASAQPPGDERVRSDPQDAPTKSDRNMERTSVNT